MLAVTVARTQEGCFRKTRNASNAFVRIVTLHAIRGGKSSVKLQNAVLNVRTNISLHFTALHGTARHCTALHCIGLNYTELNWTELYAVRACIIS